MRRKHHGQKVVKSLILKKYNAFIGGVDVSDMICTYLDESRTLKIPGEKHFAYLHECY
jgi:hypothetical protein